MTTATTELPSLPFIKHSRSQRTVSPATAASLDAPEHNLAPRAAARSRIGVAPPPFLRICTFGRFEVSMSAAGGARSPVWGSEEGGVVLKVLLAAARYRLAREQVIEYMWPGQSGTQGRDALRHTLSRLRRVLEPGGSAYGDSAVIGSSREEVWLNVEPQDDATSPLWVDRFHFERDTRDALDVLLRHTPDAAGMGERLGERALALYAGPFLPADVYADWAQDARARCQRLWGALTRALADHAAVQHRFEHALLLLAELFAALPADEAAAARLMRVQAASGHRPEALRAYEIVCAQLDADLGARPTRELKDLSHTIRTSESQQELQRLIFSEVRSQPSSPIASSMSMP